MGKFANHLIAGMTEAVAYANGTKSGATAHVVETPDVRAIRRQLHMSLHEFADAYRIPLATLKNWEQRRRVPNAPAAAYLHAISREPQVIRNALQPASYFL